MANKPNQEENTELLAIVEARMKSGEPFSAYDLHKGDYKGPIYRLADRTIQRWRKKGYISHTRQGATIVWSLTNAGKVAKNVK